jgi:zinc transporter 9
VHEHDHFHGGKDNIVVTTVGLVLHSLADGTALGASLFCKINLVTSIVSSRSGENQNAGLGLIIFFALLLHKAPAALGFGSFLRHENVNQTSLIKHLGVSLSLTYFIVFHSCRTNCHCHLVFRTAILGKCRNQ